MLVVVIEKRKGELFSLALATMGKASETERQPDRHRLQPNAAVGAISTDPRPNAGTRFMVERIENEASKAQGQLEERSRRKEGRLSVRKPGVRNDERAGG